MDTDKLFNELQTMLKQANIETDMIDGVEGQIGKTFRALLPVSEDGSKVLTEMAVSNYTEDAHLLQIYTTMILKIGPGYEALKEMILDWNLTCALGAFGIFRSERQFYHKYNYPLPIDVPPDEMALEIFYLINLILNDIAEVFPDAVRISGHN